MKSGLVIAESSISDAWAKAFLALMEKGGDVRHPSIVRIDGLESLNPIEDFAIRSALDRTLKEQNQSSCATVGNTIFPVSMWNPSNLNHASVLFERYEKAWAGIKKCPQNRNGVYFRRLMSFHAANSTDAPINQLEFIVKNYLAGNHRKSAMQASIFDPSRDHTANRQKGFPCMQQVSFTPLTENLLSVTGYYATQYQFEKAYGNYLGLFNLGKFMARQLNMELSQVVCIASVLSRGDAKKGALVPLAEELEKILLAKESIKK